MQQQFMTTMMLMMSGRQGVPPLQVPTLQAMNILENVNDNKYTGQSDVDGEGKDPGQGKDPE